MNDQESIALWSQVGQLLRNARELAGLSIRAAAKKAGVSEGLWRELERGFRTPRRGSEPLPINPQSRNLARAWRAVGQDPRHIFQMVGRPYDDFDHQWDASVGTLTADDLFQLGLVGRQLEESARKIQVLVGRLSVGVELPLPDEE